MDIVKINDRISYIKASSDPLSADVGIVRGDCATYFFDVGCNDQVKAYINCTEGRKIAVLSHFHPDHVGNASDILCDEIYLGNYTMKSVGRGTPVTKPLVIEDGVKLNIFPLPSSHAKGCLGLEVDDEYAFVGDATYCTGKNNMAVYNASLLYEELKVLKDLKAEYLVISHEERIVKKRLGVIRFLEAVYARRKKDEPYIEIGPI